MREILFRGKAIDDNWYYGVPLIFTKDYVFMTAPHTYNKAVILETVGQYTGLTDKNGKKIFEGDILSYEYGNLKKQGFVYYYDRGAKFGIKQNDGYGNLSLLHDTQVKAWNVTVIGNIHDNPELLKGENDA